MYGKRFYTIHPVSGALKKSSEQLYDVVCDRAHVLIEEATNVNGALRLMLEPDRAGIVESKDFNAKLAALIDAAISHDLSAITDATKGLKHFLRRYLSTTEAA